MKTAAAILESFLKGRFSLLLLTMALIFFSGPFFPGDDTLLDKGMGLLGLAVMLSCLRAISPSRRFFIFMAVFSLINVGLGGTAIFSSSEPHGFKAVELSFRLAYFVCAFVGIMAYVLDKSPVTADKIFGAISAYILIGVGWAAIYSLFYHFQPDCFSLPDGSADIWPYYYSFTTLTTVGYGDITSRLPAVQSYSVMEAAFGQIFLAVIIARLVALHIVHSNDKA